MTLFDLMDKLEKDLSLTPEQKFRLAADIKRYVHGEKYGLLYRLRIYFLGTEAHPASPSREFTQNVLDEKIKTHETYMSLPDDEVLTFSMGSFVYDPKKPRSTDQSPSGV